VLAGRVTRGLTADSGDEPSSVGSGSGTGYAGAYPPVTPPVTYGTGTALAGSGYVDTSDDVETYSDVDTYGDVETYGEVRPEGTYPVVDPVEELDPLGPGGRRELDDPGLR
jgi:hypothetical protein